MLNKAAAALGREVAAEIRAPRARREKLATAVITLVKKANFKKTGGMGWGKAWQGATKAWPLIQKLLPWLGVGAASVGAGVGGSALYRHMKQPSAAGAGGGLFGGGKKPLWNPTEKKMWGRMNINPQEEMSRTRAMRDVGAGGLWRAQQNKERQALIRGMYNQ